MLNNSESQTINKVVTSSSNVTNSVAQAPKKPRKASFLDDFDEISADVSAAIAAEKAEKADKSKKVAEVPKAVEVPKVAEASEPSKFNLKALRKLAKNFSGDTALVPCFKTSEGLVDICPGAEEWRKCEISKHDLEDFPNINALGMVLDKYLMLKCSDNAGIELPDTLRIGDNSCVFRIPEDLEQPIKSFSNEEFEVTTGSDQYQLVAGAGIKTNENYQIAELSPALLQLVTNQEIPQKLQDSEYPKFDKEQAIEQLRLLNYQDGDEVFLRAIYPTKHRTKGAVSLPPFKFPNFPVADIEKYQKEERGIYVVVNGGGHSDDFVKEGKALFFEFDNLLKNQQIEWCERHNLPSPTFLIATGGKSIHNYLVFHTPVQIGDWVKLTEDFLATIGKDADQVIKNPSRVMRLAGGWYINADGSTNGQSKIIKKTGAEYEFNDLRSLIPKQFTIEEDISVAKSILQSGVLDYLAEDYNDWVKVGMALHSVDDCLSVDWDAWSKKSDKYKPGECDEKWNSFNASEGFGLGSLIYLAKQKGWKYPKNIQKKSSKSQSSKTNSQTSSNPPNGENNKSNTSNDYLQEVKNAIGENLTRAKLTSKIQEIAGKFKKTSFDVTALYNQFAEELETENGRDERREEVNELVNLRGSRFDIGEYLPKSLSDSLKMSAKALGVDAEGLLTLLIPNAASMIHVKSRTKAADNGWVPEPFIFYTAIVSPSGNRKSPMLSLVSKPLQDFQEKAKETYDLNLAVYETEHETWECSGKPGGLEPLKPVPMQEYYLEDFTFESIAKIQERQINKSLVIIKDELSGYFNGMGSYKNGKGTDFESFLELWNGKGLKVNRASGDVITVPRLAISLTGGIQPKTLLKMMGDLTDYKGGWARFLYYNAPRRLYKVDLFSKSPNISMILTEIYQNIADMPQTEFALDVEATTILESWMQNNETLKAKESREALVNALAKLVGYVVRLSGLHEVLKSAASGELSTGIVRADSVTAAIKLADFYYQQLVLIHSEAAADSKEAELSPKLAKTLNEAIKKGQLTVRDFIRSNNKASKPDALQIFEELSAMGLGRVEKVKTSVVFIPSPISLSTSTVNDLI